MSMYTLKSVARRSTFFGAAVAVFAATVVPAAPAFADALNPLTERSLLLTSSAPGFQDTDGSNNSTYAPPGSGPNGSKTGQTFSFVVSSDSTTTNALEAMTFQYCTEAAGFCQAPGNNSGNGDPSDDGSMTGSTRVANNPTGWDAGTSDLEVVYTGAVEGTDFDVFVDADDDGVFEAGEEATGWALGVSNVEDHEHAGVLTGKNNYITLTNSTTPLEPAAGTRLGVKFYASETDFITNPGDDKFFVKINTYNAAAAAPANVVDGGVTVANMMTDSIHITTKVLETMDFSVGVQNPDTTTDPHGSCDAINVVDNNRLDLGNPSAEFSLETDTAYDTHSYWRLSSNSSGGATVYYSGETLNNTVGDNIDEMGAEDYSHPGTEQFGLALVDAGVDTVDPEGTDNDGTNDFPANWIPATISPLTINSSYDEGDTASISDPTTTNNAKFAFYASSNTIPEVIAQDNDDVLPCVTSKVRYVANIAADTPAGVYTTKINYLAAPQY